MNDVKQDHRQPRQSPRQNWEEQFRAMSENGDDQLLDIAQADLTEWDTAEWDWPEAAVENSAKPIKW
jgi:hypothetical protein